MGDLVVIDGKLSPRNIELAQSMRRMANLIEDDPNKAASYALVIAYQDGTIGIEYGGGMLTTLLGGTVALTARIEREL